jgi:hypothetical protein
MDGECLPVDEPTATSHAARVDIVGWWNQVDADSLLPPAGLIADVLVFESRWGVTTHGPVAVTVPGRGEPPSPSLCSGGPPFGKGGQLDGVVGHFLLPGGREVRLRYRTLNRCSNTYSMDSGTGDRGPEPDGSIEIQDGSLWGLAVAAAMYGAKTTSHPGSYWERIWLPSAPNSSHPRCSR